MEVGDYVRTDNGCICKILKYTDISDNDFYVNTDSQYDVIYKSWIVKSSPNIIDLIEVGDYVNGYKVLFAGATTWDNDGNVIDKRVKINYDGYDRWLSEDFIKSIVTKEQFSQMEYKVGE